MMKWEKVPMGMNLSVHLVTRFPEDSMTDFLTGKEPQIWIKNLSRKFCHDLSKPRPPSSTVQNSPEGRLVTSITQADTSSDHDAVSMLRRWTEILVRESGHYPILFYLTLGRKPQELSLDYIDEGIFQLGGPLLLIEADLWYQNQFLRNEFKNEGSAPFLDGQPSIVIREPESVWMKRFEQNMSRIREKPVRHPLEYKQNNEDSLPAEEKENRKHLQTSLIETNHPSKIPKFLGPIRAKRT